MIEDDKAAIEKLMVGMSDAWNAADADAYGELFTEDASYVDVMGGLSRGRAEIVEGHRWLFAKMPGSKMVSGGKQNRDIRFLTADTALVLGSGGGVTVSDDQLTEDRVSTISLVAVRAGDGWRFAHFQNTRTRR